MEVTRIAPDSPAEKAGIKTGDVVTQYNGQRVEGMDQFSRMVRETPAGREVKIGIIRNGAPQTITAKIVARPAISGQLIPAPVQNPFELRFPDMPQSRMTWRSTMLGIEAEALDGQLAEFFGVKEGVLVRAVTKGRRGQGRDQSRGRDRARGRRQSGDARGYFRSPASSARPSGVRGRGAGSQGNQRDADRGQQA